MKATISPVLEEHLLAGLNLRHERDVPLGPMTWYGIGGPASILAHPSSVHQLAALATRCHETGTCVYVLGSGANVLIADEGVPGVVVRLDDPFFRRVSVEGHRVTAGAGADLAKLILDTVRLGLGGLECLSGIPATIGGAVRMNAGGRFGSIGPTVRRLMVCDPGGQVYYRTREDLAFGYRLTNITARYILEAELELTPGDAKELRDRAKEIMASKKASQPMGDSSAGCAFKNPTPPAGGEALSAGKLIDQAGLKGFRIGGAEVSPRHANFIVAHRGCTCGDVLRVLEHVRDRVRERFGVELEREIVVWP